MLDYHEFLFLISKVCPNESLPLGSCGPRRCIIGLSIPAYPSGKCIAVVGLYPTQFGNEGRLGTSCSECSADGTKLLTPSTRTNEYDMVPSLKLNYMYTAEASTNGYGMGPSLEEYRLGASPTLKHRSDGISLSITALLYLMLICLWVFVLNTKPSVASCCWRVALRTIEQIKAIGPAFVIAAGALLGALQIKARRCQGVVWVSS